MAIRQYIGARYVLKIYENSLDPQSADWEAGVVYEPLVMVNYNNSSYISRKTVPANIGNPVSNPTYWALSGLYNGQIASLQTQINAIDNLIGSGTLPHNEDDIIDALNYLNDPYDYAIWIGDSYVGAASLPAADRSNRFSTRVSTWLNLTEKNYAVGGTGFMYGDPTFEHQLDNAILDFTTNSLDKTKVKYVFIAGGRNDVETTFTKNDYMAAIRAVATKANSNFPNAEIIFIPYLWDASMMNFAFLEYIDWFKEAQCSWGNRITIIDNAYTWLTGRFELILYQSGANVHPSIVGHYRIARHIYSALMGNNWIDTSFVNHAYNDEPTRWNANVGGGSKFVIVKRNNEINCTIALNMATDFTGSGNLFTHNANLAYIFESFLGRTNIYFDLVPQEFNGNSVKCVLQPSYTKTGDTAGTFQNKIYKYGGTLQAGKQYYANFTIPNGSAVVPTF